MLTAFIPIMRFTQINTMHCETCQKPIELCVCAEIRPQDTRLHVLILQHPQEPDHEIGSARLAHLALPNSTLKIGLSWRNLAAALGQKEADPSHWAVLYLGSGIKSEGARPQPLQFVSQKGAPIATPEHLEGIVLLDGTWSQAKSLWWRNAWLLKLRRAILTPQRKSLYKELRKEPRRECLSTIESTSETLDLLGEKPEVGEHLRTLFSQLLDQRRRSKKSS
ncbi:MAG: DTW domain-containing protein [Gammaproteobacteria bacterium]|jgi:DTW domain-containing protein YfiP|nr:DTW domain-containing protein [Gammaproteobacteria bacterium]